MFVEIRQACRRLAGAPAFTMSVIAVIALGIGVNTAVFSVLNAVLLKPVGIPDADRIVSVRVKYDKLNLRSLPVSVPDFADVRDARHTFSHAAVMEEADFHFLAGDSPGRLQGARVSQEWFGVFSAKPTLGRVFAAEEDQPNANRVTVLSDSAWRRLFGSDPSVIGKNIILNSQPYRVIGVIGASFRWPRHVDLWVPIGLAAGEYGAQNRFNEALPMFARLQPGYSFAQADSIVRLLAGRVLNGRGEAGAYARASPWNMLAVPMAQFVGGEARGALLLLMGAVLIVLLIACANAGGLLLARASAQSRDHAIRIALGATRHHIIRHGGAEVLLLTLGGMIVGSALAYFLVRGMLLFAPGPWADGLEIRPDRELYLFTGLVALASSILFGVAPVLRAAQAHHTNALNGSGRGGTASRTRLRLRSTLVVAEVALTAVLLVGAGLLIRSLVELQNVQTGFDPNAVLTATLSLPQPEYKDAKRRINFYRELSTRIEGGPGIAGMGGPIPFSGIVSSASFTIEGRRTRPGEPSPHADIRYASPNYFPALGIPLRSGRLFTKYDQQGQEPVVIVDENLARQFWPGEAPLGKRLRRGTRGPWFSVIGVVGHVKQTSLAGDTGKGVIYYSLFQEPPFLTHLLLRTQFPPASATLSLREAIGAASPSLAIYDLKLMQDRVDASLGPHQFATTLLLFFAFSALGMAAIGLYGLISYSIAQRTREIGIRVAIGADPGCLVKSIVLQGLRLTLIGIAIGILTSAVLTRVIANQLFGIGQFDPVAFIAMILVLLLVTFCAAYLPARRAASISPLSALRAE